MPRFGEAKSKTPGLFDSQGESNVDDDSDKWRICPNCHAEIKKDMRDAVCSNCGKFFVSPGNNIAGRMLPEGSPIMSACATCKAISRIPAAETTFICPKPRCESRNEKAPEMANGVGVSPCKKCGTVAGIDSERMLQCSNCGAPGLRNPEPATAALKANTVRIIGERSGKSTGSATAEEEPVDLTLAEPETEQKPLPVAKLLPKLPVAKLLGNQFSALGFDEAGASSARQAYSLPLSDIIKRALKRSGVTNLPTYDEMISGQADIPAAVVALAFRSGNDSFVTPAKVRARLMGMLGESGKSSENDPFKIIDSLEQLRNKFPELQLPSSDALEKFVASNPPQDIVRAIVSGKALSGGRISHQASQSIQRWLEKVPSNKWGDASRALMKMVGTMDKRSAVVLSDFLSDLFHT